VSRADHATAGTLLEPVPAEAATAEAEPCQAVVEEDIQEGRLDAVLLEPIRERLAVAQPGIMLPVWPADRVAVLQADGGGEFRAGVEFQRRTAQAGTMGERLRVLDDPQRLAEGRQRGRIARVADDFVPEGSAAEHATGDGTDAGHLRQQLVEVALGGVGAFESPQV
jgi:hypothetical protein